MAACTGVVFEVQRPDFFWTSPNPQGAQTPLERSIVPVLASDRGSSFARSDNPLFGRQCDALLRCAALRCSRSPIEDHARSGMKTLCAVRLNREVSESDESVPHRKTMEGVRSP